MPNLDMAFKPVSDQAGRMVENSWKRILAIAQNHVQDFEQDEENTSSSSAMINNLNNHNQSNSGNSSNSGTSEFYDRERHMVHALDTLFSLAYEGPGYLAFISTITSNLDPESPVAMAFLSHIIDRAALPSRETMSSVSPIIISKLYKKPSRIQRMISFLSTTQNTTKYHNSNSGGNNKRSSLSSHKSNIKKSSSSSSVNIKVKLNAAIIWSLLAEKFAGEMCLFLWQQDVADLLMKSIADVNEDLMVRIFSLLALEKFALTGSVKERILSHSEFNIRSILLTVVKECELANEQIYLKIKNNNQESNSLLNEKAAVTTTIIPNDGNNNKTPSNDRSTFFLIPPIGSLREEWTRYIQFGLCTRWALDHVFIDGKKITCPWDLSNLNVIMNPFDSTPHLKIGGNGLEIRNDRPHFESVRATACVKKDKWYYETLLLSNGIMQIGWATSRCRFSPEEGYGVGDDCNGFAFDTYRTAVWADGSAVYPQNKVKIRCQAGDVIGSFLDLDNGFCSYYINGRDLGLTVEFEHPNRQTYSSSSSLLSSSDSLITSTIEESEEDPYSDSTVASYETANSDFQQQQQQQQQQQHPPVLPHKNNRSVKGLGLYPAISLTTHQQAFINFGEKKWMFEPPTNVKFKGICEAGQLDDAFCRRVMRWVRKRGVTSHGKSYQPMNKPPLRPRTPSDSKNASQKSLKNGSIESLSRIESSSSTATTSASATDSDSSSSNSSSHGDETKEEEDDDYDWDGPLCTICFSEPKDTILMPCKHGGIGGKCAKALIMCHLCRADIKDRLSIPVDQRAENIKNKK